MSKKFTAIAVSIIFLTSAASLLAEEKVPALQKELESRQPSDLPQPPHPAEAARQPVARRRVRARSDNQVEVDVVERRIRVDREQQPVHQQAPARLRQFLQTENRWFNALKGAYREGDMDRVGRLIDRMEQFRKRVRNRLESAQEMHPLVRQRRRVVEDYQPQEHMRNFRARRRYGGPIDEAPAFRRQLRQEQRRRFRMQDMTDQQLERPAAPTHQEYCENCTCERCRQLRARQKRQLRRLGVEGREPGRFGPYEEEGIQQRQPCRQGPWQQWRPKEDIPENEESDFDWDW